jgi:hypothetical protein
MKYNVIRNTPANRALEAYITFNTSVLYDGCVHVGAWVIIFMGCFGDAKALSGVSVAFLDQAWYFGTLGPFLCWGVLDGGKINCLCFICCLLSCLGCLSCFFLSKKVIGADAVPCKSFFVFCFGPVVCLGLVSLLMLIIIPPSKSALASLVLGGEIVTELVVAFS